LRAGEKKKRCHEPGKGVRREGREDGPYEKSRAAALSAADGEIGEAGSSRCDRVGRKGIFGEVRTLRRQSVASKRGVARVKRREGRGGPKRDGMIAFESARYPKTSSRLGRGKPVGIKK